MYPPGTHFGGKITEFTDDILTCAIDQKDPACERVSHLPSGLHAESYPAELNIDFVAYIVRDAAVGALIPLFLIFVVPTIARRYLRWLKSGSSN
jgi:hypothetical protein